MVHSYGYKSGTRHLFQKKFGTNGNPSPASYLTTFKLGEYVDVVADPSVRKGMPHKYYHGRTGIVWNITPRGVGVIVNKLKRNRLIRKRICVRAEHVRKSRCRESFVKLVKSTQDRQKAKKAGKAEAPKTVSRRTGGMVRKANVEVLQRDLADYEKMCPY